MAGRGAFAKYGVSVPDGSVKARNAVISAAATAHDRVMSAGGTDHAATLAGRIAAHQTAGARVGTMHGPEGSFKGVRSAHRTMATSPGGKPVNREAATNAGPRPVNRDAATNPGTRGGARPPTNVGTEATLSGGKPANREAATNAGPRAAQPPKSNTNIVGLSPDVARAAKQNPTMIGAGHIRQNWDMLPEHYRDMVRAHPVVKAGLMSPEYAYANITSGMRPFRGNHGDTAAATRHWESEFQRNLVSGQHGGAAHFKGTIGRVMPAPAPGQPRQLPPTLAGTLGMTRPGGGVAKTVGMTPPAKTVGMTGAGPKPAAPPTNAGAKTNAGPKATNAGPQAPSAKPALETVKVPGGRKGGVGNDNRVRQTKGERKAAVEERKKALTEKRAQRAAERDAKRAEREARKAANGGGKGRRGKGGHGEKGHGAEKAAHGKSAHALATIIRKIVEVPLGVLQSAAGTTANVVGGQKHGGH